MGRVNLQTGPYSLKAQQQFYRRYNQIKKVDSEMSKNDMSQNQSVACSECVMRGDDSHCRGRNENLNNSRQEIQEAQTTRPWQHKFDTSAMILSSREHHVTQEYFAEDNNEHQMTGTEQTGAEDMLTDDDIAVFRS